MSSCVVCAAVLCARLCCVYGRVVCTAVVCAAVLCVWLCCVYGRVVCAAVLCVRLSRVRLSSITTASLLPTDKFSYRMAKRVLLVMMIQFADIAHDVEMLLRASQTLNALRGSSVTGRWR